MPSSVDLSPVFLGRLERVMAAASEGALAGRHNEVVRAGRELGLDHAEAMQLGETLGGWIARSDLAPPAVAQIVEASAETSRDQRVAAGVAHNGLRRLCFELYRPAA